MPTHPDNHTRADWAEQILQHFKRLTGPGLSDDEALRDLITDLGHLAGRIGLDFIDETARALGAWQLEQDDPHSIGPAPHVAIIFDAPLPSADRESSDKKAPPESLREAS